MSPKPNVSKQRIAQILEAAAVVSAQKGFENTTMDDIAGQVGINKATIYCYFENKDALIRAMAETLFAQELTSLQAAHDSPGTATERLTVYYEALIAGEPEVLPLMPLLYEFYALGLRRAEVRAVISGFIEQLAGLLAAIIEEGIQQGEFAPTEARAAARAFDSLLSGTILHWVYAPEEVNLNDQLRFGVRLFFQGLNPKEPIKQE